MPRMKSTGDIPPAPPRGAVTPPATRSRRSTALIAAYATFSRVVYRRADTGRRNIRLFGSFQIVQWRTSSRYRLAAARANEANHHLLRGAQFGLRPAFAQRGVPHMVTIGAIPRAFRPRMTASANAQS